MVTNVPMSSDVIKEHLHNWK